MKRTRRSEAALRAADDRAYLEQMKGDGTPDPLAPKAMPVAPADAALTPTEAMPHVPTAAPLPPLGVSPILGEDHPQSAPPVGSFQQPAVGPPGPAYVSRSAASTAGWPQAPGDSVPSASSMPSAADGSPSHGAGVSADRGQGPGPLRKSGSHQQTSYVEQSPVGTLDPPQYAPAPQAPQFAQPSQFAKAPQFEQASAPQHGQQGRQPMPPRHMPVGSDLPLLLGPTGIAPTGDLVTCPECGEMATVDAARRKSEDFCRHCDFPLFWARTTVILPSGEETGASLRRLPGTVGRAATAALMCPHCGEPNSPVAQNCVRCLLSLHLVPEVIPEPVYLPPEPEPMPVAIGREYPLWWIILVTACILVIGLLVVWGLAN